VTVHEQQHVLSEQPQNLQEQLHNLQERLREHVHRIPETHHTRDRDLHQGQQPLDRVADLQDLEAGEVFAEEINPH